MARAKKDKKSPVPVEEEPDADFFDDGASELVVEPDPPIPPHDPTALAKLAAEAVISKSVVALVPVYSAHGHTFLFGGQTYDVPAGGVAGVPRPACPSAANVKGCRTLFGSDATKIDGATNLPLPGSKRLGLNLALIAEADAE